MPLGTKWIVEFETTEPIGDIFIEGMILEGVGSSIDDPEIAIAKNIKVTCLKETQKPLKKMYSVKHHKEKLAEAQKYLEGDEKSPSPL